MDELSGLLFSLAAGLLVGVERGWRQRSVAEGHRPAGLRTFGVIGLLGGLGALGAQRWGDGVLIALGAAVALALVAGYGATVWMHRAMGLTTLMAGLATFMIGALAAGGAPAAGPPRGGRVGGPQSTHRPQHTP
ncbi:MAG: MgtC/SapB family protein, partial [Arenimonas sp.]|uniref:MgtC/SapB family protein n=1 Tax=Arenimonas sp. TaxID=1872635 RepID=UPI0025BF675F